MGMSIVDDCVSRTLVQSTISKSIEYKENPYQLYKRIERLPSVTPQPKMGHWIFVGEENEEETRNGNFRYICSECGYSDVHAKSTEVPYCWHCGAKMVEPQESEET